jgi:hypothetical protein
VKLPSEKCCIGGEILGGSIVVDVVEEEARARDRNKFQSEARDYANRTGAQRSMTRIVSALLNFLESLRAKSSTFFLPEGRKLNQRQILFGSIDDHVI